MRGECCGNKLLNDFDVSRAKGVGLTEANKRSTKKSTKNPLDLTLEIIFFLNIYIHTFHVRLFEAQCTYQPFIEARYFKLRKRTSGLSIS